MTLFQLKKTIKQALKSNKLESVISLVRQDRRAVNVLISFSYDKKSVESWRAIKVIGLSAAALVESHYDFFRETTRRLLWSITEESGGIGWSAIEMLGEIICAAPDRFHDLIPIIASFYHEEDFFREGVLYALSRLSEVSPGAVSSYHELITKSLSDINPLVRAYALECVKRTRMKGAQDIIRELLKDDTMVNIYKDDDFVQMKISSMAHELLP